MTDQKNLPRTREEQIDVVYPDESSELIMTKDYYVHALLEAEARGRAEALAELSAGAEPVKYEVRDLRISGQKWLTCSRAGYDAYQGADGIETRALYDHAPIVREAELAAEVERLRGVLIQADQFISNGIEFGFIRMPDLDTPDSAHKTPGMIRAALAAAPETPHD